jgi:signal transduction histidine kinase
VTVFRTLRAQFALLYAGAFGVTGLVVLALTVLAVKSTVHAGTGAPPVTTRPYAHALGPLAVILAALVVLSLASGWLLAGRLLRPVRAITAAARDISATNLSRRLPLGGRENELTRLGQTLNELFARLEASFQAQRHFVASASHELRTPLAAERALLQVALADPGADAGTLREACEQVLNLGTRTERLIDGLLTLATGERGIERREPFDLAVVAARVVESRGVGPGGVRLSLALAPTPAAGDPRLAESLVANLADNALAYNVPGGWVGIRTAARGGRAVLSVRNTGPVIPPGELDRLFQPFQRRGAARAGAIDRDGGGRDGSGGHGLGLAIVRAIADAHGATVTARARDDGGLDIEVSFPEGS